MNWKTEALFSSCLHFAVSVLFLHLYALGDNSANTKGESQNTGLLYEILGVADQFGFPVTRYLDFKEIK